MTANRESFQSISQRAPGLIMRNCLAAWCRCRSRTRHCAAAAQEQRKAFPFIQRMMRRCWDSQTDNWQDYIEQSLIESGLDGPKVIEDVKANPDKYQSIIAQNETDLRASGHGGVPNSVFRGEPFWGQDRIDMLIWRLEQNGLTQKWPVVD